MAVKEVESKAGTGSGSGGSSGMGIMSAATDLGDKLHNNMLGMVSYFRDSREARERNAMLDAEEKRQFNIQAGQTDRQQGLQGIGLLAEQRQGADTNARLRSFRKALLNG